MGLDAGQSDVRSDSFSPLMMLLMSHAVPQKPACSLQVLLFLFSCWLAGCSWLSLIGILAGCWTLMNGHTSQDYWTCKVFCVAFELWVAGFSSLHEADIPNSA